MKAVKIFFKIIGILIILFLILLVFPEREIVKPIQPRGSTQYWEMSEGFDIAFTHIKSNGNRSPIIFLHGGPGGYIHSSIIECLSDLKQYGHDVYFYDQRGSGLSDRLDKFSDVSFEKHLLDLHEIIEVKIKAKKVILIGQSFGSNLASHYSAVHQEKVEKIVFSSPGGFIPHRQKDGEYVDLEKLYPTPDSLHFIKPYSFINDVNKMSRKPKAIIAVMGALFLDKKLISDKQMDRMLNTLASRFTKGMVCDPSNVLPEEGGGGLYAFLASNNDDVPEIRNKLKEVQAPVLVLQGQCEYHSYASAFEYKDLYPNGSYKFIKGAGHEIWWEEKEAFINAIVQFLKK